MATASPVLPDVASVPVRAVSVPDVVVPRVSRVSIFVFFVPPVPPAGARTVDVLVGRFDAVVLITRRQLICPPPVISPDPSMIPAGAAIAIIALADFEIATSVASII
jgi:hypothetical protein